MRPWVVCVVLSGVMIFGTSKTASAQAVATSSSIRPNFEINVFGGLTRFSSPGLIDNACRTFAAIAYDAQDAGCSGNGQGSGITYGGEFGYRYPIRNGMSLVFLGGAEFGSKHQLEIAVEATDPIYGAQYNAVEGYHFRTTHIYGGVGVRMNKMMIGGTFGRTLHSGRDSFAEELSLAGVPLDGSYDEQDESGSGGLFGLRFQYDLRP